MSKKKGKRNNQNRRGSQTANRNKFSKQTLESYAKTALMGALQGNLPEALGAIGAYITYRDKPYGIAVAVDQIKDTALVHSLTGAGTDVLMRMIR
jgi:hypothetical protein